MKKLLYVSFVTSMVISTAIAAVSPYVGISGGLGLLSDSDLSGGGLSGELSYDTGYVI